MKGQVVLIGIAGIIGAGGLIYKKVSDLRNELYMKRQSELREIESEWHRAGWNAGYECGKSDAERDAMIQAIRDKNGGN